MTAIAAIAHRGHVYVGGDSAVTDDSGDLAILREPKVWFAAPGLIVGHAGDGAAAEALRWSVNWTAPRANAQLDNWAHRDLARMLAPALDCCHDDSIIVAARGTIWVIDITSPGEDKPGRLQFNTPAEPFAAVGSGGPAARAALASLRGSKMAPRAKVLRALEIAEAQRSDVRRPFLVLEA